MTGLFAIIRDIQQVKKKIIKRQLTNHHNNLQCLRIKHLELASNSLQLVSEVLFRFLLRNISNSRSSHSRCSMKKGVLRNVVKFTGKHLWQSLFFNKVAGPRPATLLKKRLYHRCFLVSFMKFLRTPFLQNTSGRLLL